MKSSAPNVGPSSSLNKEQVEELLRTAHWQVAKTMPWLPHEYSLSKFWTREVFEAVVQYIRDTGQPESFGKRTFIYYYLDGYKHWTMGCPMGDTILINRAKAGEPRPQPKPQPKLDDWQE